jgi:2-oxoisovalerate dehydrogenase E1 component alpha subunit
VRACASTATTCSRCTRPPATPSTGRAAARASTSDDPRAYRNADEVEPWTRRDPIERFRKYLNRRNLWDVGEDDRIKATITTELMAAIERAEKTPAPNVDSLFSDVFADRPWHLVEQQKELEDFLGPGYVTQKGH